MAGREILDSWKEISACLHRNVRTCQIWERELGLPVHRLDGSPKARVFAYRDEIDGWLAKRFDERRRRARTLFIGALSALAVAAGILAFFVLRSRPGRIDSLAVLPLSDLSEDWGEAYFVEGMHDALIGELAKIRSLKIIGRRNVLRYQDTKASLRDIARELGVAAIVEGSVVRSGERIRISVELVDGRTGERLWGPFRFDRNEADILSLYSEIALAIAREINAKLTDLDVRNLSRKQRIKPEAYRLYLQAELLYEKRMLEQRDEGNVKARAFLDLLRRSTELDPSFALGYAVTANILCLFVDWGVLTRDEAYPRAKEAALKAVALDDSLADAHAALGNVLFSFEWDIAGAEREYRRAMNAGLKFTHSYPSRFFTLTGHFDEAIGIKKREIEENPLFPDYANLGWSLLYARRYDEAIEACNKAMELNIGVFYNRVNRSNIYALKHRCVEALAETRELMPKSPFGGRDFYWATCLACNYGLCGERARALDIIKALADGSNPNRDFLGLIYGAMGEKDLAIAALTEACEQRSASMLFLKVEPMLDSLREDPRFIALLKRVGFEK